jgi:hypothetical protein
MPPIRSGLCYSNTSSYQGARWLLVQHSRPLNVCAPRRSHGPDGYIGRELQPGSGPKPLRGAYRVSERRACAAVRGHTIFHWWPTFA